DVVCRVHCNHSSTTKKATFFSDGKIDGSVCEACGYETAIKIIYQIKNINLSKTSGVFNGKSQIPTITVKDRANKTISPTNYNVTFSKGFKNVGKHTIVVQFKNNYSGKRTLTYKINPDKTTISSLKATSKGFAVTLKKQTKQTTGYQIQYSKTKGFATHKTITLGKTSITKKTVSKLLAKKKYYVRVRTYKTIGKTQFNSPWSSVKSVVTK
ncbi:MAG: fibronectin type III domain-containing protein, partial [Ruminococcus sp.]